MTKYKIIYRLNSDIKVTYIDAPNMIEAIVYFYTNYACDDMVTCVLADGDDDVQ